MSRMNVCSYEVALISLYTKEKIKDSNHKACMSRMNVCVYELALISLYTKEKKYSYHKGLYEPYERLCV